MIGKTEKVIVSAPGTLMLMGEHAVLRGHLALACAVNQRIRVDVQKRSDGRLCIESALASVQLPVDECSSLPSSLRFVSAVLDLYVSSFPTGLDVHIQSDFSHTVGLGSSAAVTVALVAALRRLAGMDRGKEKLFADAFGVIRKVQGRGSGADVAACVYGGITAYQMEPLKVESVAADPPLTLIFCGYKKPTVEVIALVEEAERTEPASYEQIFTAMNRCARAGWAAVKEKNWTLFGSLLNEHQELMRAVRLNTPELDEIVTTLQSLPGIYGAKISGSGLGDCVLALGQAEWTLEQYQEIPIDISQEGVLFENEKTDH